MSERRNIWNDMAQWDRMFLNEETHRTLRHRILNAVWRLTCFKAPKKEKTFAPRKRSGFEDLIVRGKEEISIKLFDRTEVRLKTRVERDVIISVRQSVNQALQASMRTPEDPKKRKWISSHE